MQWYSDKALFLSDLIGRNEAGMRNKMSPQKILAQNSGKILWILGNDIKIQAHIELIFLFVTRIQAIR